MEMHQEYYLSLLAGSTLLKRELREGRYVDVKFPSLNKNGDLRENDEQIAKGSSVERCMVVMSVALPAAVYKVVGDTLLADNELWRCIGGSYSDDPRLDEVEVFSGMTQEQMEIYRSTAVTLVVEVINRNRIHERFYVNTEGHEYARYVGRLTAETGERGFIPKEFR